MSQIVLKGRWFNIMVLNVHAPSEKKNDDSKDGFYEKLGQVFYHFPKYHIKILLGDFNVKVGRANIFKLTIGNESLPQDSNDNGVRTETLPHQKLLLLRAFISTPRPLLMGRLMTR
jgi:hypothetical protein